MAFQKNRDNKKSYVRINHSIRVPKVRLIKDNENLGIVATQDALRQAQDAGLDLVEVAPQANPPVCQIMDFGKFKYERSKREKDGKQPKQKEKEVTFRYVIDQHDLETKANQIKSFLEKGYKVKVTVKYKKREKAHKEQGFIAIRKCIELLGDVVKIEKAPTLEGDNLSARLDLNRQQKGKKDGEQVQNPVVQSVHGTGVPYQSQGSP